MIDINVLLKNKKYYNRVFTTYYNRVLDDFDYREKIIKLKTGETDKLLRMKISQFLVNIILWRPFLVFKREFDKGFIFNTSGITANQICDYMDKVIREFISADNQIELNECISSMINDLSNFSLDFNFIIGNTINLKDKIDLAKRNERYNEIIHTKFDNNMTTIEVEDQLDGLTKELSTILANEENHFQDYINCREGVNATQLTQFEINIGPKPDLVGKVFPKIIDSNFLVDGLGSLSDYYIDSSGGRKAAIINFNQVKKAGYNMRKLSLLCMDTLLSDIEDCKGKNYIKIHIDSEKTLGRLNYRWFKTKNGERCLDELKDQRLIGKTLKFRSPVTCSCPDGKICKKCYGRLSLINDNIHIGLLAIEILSSHLTQMMLSAKHLLKTNSEAIDWPDEFNKIFIIDSNAILLNPSLENESRYSLIIDENDIIESEDSGLDDDDSDFSKSVKTFKIKYREEFYDVAVEKDLFLSPYLEELMKTNKEKGKSIYQIGLRGIDLNEVLFYIEIENNELSKPLYNILNLTDNKEHLGVTTKEGMVQKFLELLNEGGIPINSVHIECIVRELIRKPDDIMQRPDFTEVDPEYTILRVTDGIMNSPSITISLSFEKVKRQLYDPKSYKKDGRSLLDYFFISDKRW